MAAFSQLDISNRALARIAAKPIATFGENSLEARECRRFYASVVSDMLEGPHDWSFANQIVRLALLATNDRSDLWAYAYQLPSNLGNPIRVLPDLASLGLSLPVALPGNPYAESWASTANQIEMPYEIEAGTLYTNVADARLEFTVNDIDGVVIPQLAAAALEIDLAARLAIPVKKDSARERELMQMAEIAWPRAIADDRNRQPQTYGDYVSESIAARHGDC